MIRVGTIKYENGKKIIPSYPGFEIIEVMTKSTKYGSLSPYEITDSKKRIMENIWQFSKVYEKVPKTTCYYSKYDGKIIWQHDAEIHLDHGILTNEYFMWRLKGETADYGIRYPVGFDHRHKCLYAIKEKNDGTLDLNNKLNYVDARKEIYLPKYIECVKTQKQYKELKDKLGNGVNLLICEVDGPKQESLDYYKQKYNVGDNFIENNTIIVDKNNMNIMLNDTKHAFGHGYCLALSLLNINL